MASIKFYIRGLKREKSPLFVRYSDGRKTDLIVKSGLVVDTSLWSNKKEDLKIKIRTKDQIELLSKISDLRKLIDSRVLSDNGSSEKDKIWLQNIINEFHNKKIIDAKTLNDFITQYITESKEGKHHNEHSMCFTPGTIRTWEGFQKVFNEYQGIYTEKRLQQIREENKKLKEEGKPVKKIRLLKLVDFEDITLPFYESFRMFLINEGYQINTVGRFIKQLKYFMQKSLNKKLHQNRDFQNSDVFKIPSSDSYSVYLTEEEIEKIYNYDLKQFPVMEKARDAFIVLCETALRISDYKKIDINVRTVEKKRLIYITQEKTSKPVVITVSARLEELLKKYDNNLPLIHDQYINKYIKTIAAWCGIDEVHHWQGNKYGKKYDRSAKKYELISCHTARRSAVTNMLKAGISPKYIRSITGHSTDRQLEEYAKLTSEEIALTLAVHPYYTKTKLKKVI
jgi:site-specific recombinase XerD